MNSRICYRKINSALIITLALSLGVGLGRVGTSFGGLSVVRAQEIVIENSTNAYRAANITRGETAYRSEVQADPGEAIQLLVMVHLGTEDTVAGDVAVRVDLNEAKTVRGDGSYELATKAFIASSANSVEDTTTIVVPSDQELVFIPEHGVVITSHGQLPTAVPGTPYTWPNAEELFGDGITLGGMEAVSTVYISFKAYVSNKTARMTITKEVASVSNPDGAWHAEVGAKSGERVRFQIVVKNAGASELNDILITDQLPEGLDYVLGSSRYSTPYSDGFKPLADSWITGEGGVSQANLGRLPVGEGYNAIIVFDARVGESVVSGSYQNTAQAKANEYPDWIYAQAKVVVPSEGETELSIEKFVRWGEASAWYEHIDKETHLFAAGEEVIYRVVVKNTGDTVAKDIQVVDELPNYLSWASGEGYWDEAHWEVTFDFGTMAPGEERDRSYTARVADEGKLPSGDREQENTAVLYVGEERVAEDDARVWINGPDVAAASQPEELPKAGADSLALVLISLGMVLTGWGLRKLALESVW